MSSPSRNHTSPCTPPRQSSPSNVPTTPPQPIYNSTPSNYTYTPRENARYPSNTLAPTTPPRQISSLLKPRTPTTLARAINTSLPSTPPSQDIEYLGEPVELTPLRRSLLRNQSQHSPFHDRHSVAEAIDEDPFEYHSPSGNKLKTMSKYQFSGTSPNIHQEEFGGELHEVRPVSEARRSLYSPQPPIPISTIHDHPDLFPSVMVDPTPPTPRPRRTTEPIKPKFRDLLCLSQKRDIIFDLLPAVILAIAGSLIQPYMSVIIGEAFAVFSDYPTELSSATAEQNAALSAGVIRSSIKLTIAGLVAMSLNYTKGALWIRHGEGVVARLREAVFVGVQGKQMEWFDLGMGINPDEKDDEGRNLEAIGAGGLMAKFTKETDEVRMATSGSFGNLVQYSFTFLFCFILAMWRAPILALVTLSTIPGVVLIQIVAQILIGPKLEDERRAFAEASTNIERTTAAISTVKVHNAQKTEGDRFTPIIIKAQNALIKQARVWSVTTGASETLLLSTFVLGFWYGAKLVREGKANPGDVMTVFWAALLAATYLQMVVEQLVIVTKGKSSMASLRTVIRDLPSRPTSVGQYSPGDTPSESTFGSKIRPVSMRQIRPTRCHGEYNFQNVSFYYPSRPEQWVLRDVTLFLPPGETTFIVGGSGSGKSTVAQLLLRLYTPVGGEITLDDRSIAYLDDEFTKENIAAVQQGCILFDMSVHDNVAMGRAGAGVDNKTGIRKRPQDVSRMEVEEACRMAMIHDFIMSLPEGYDTILGTGGNSLSGGQRQRLAIARARIRDPTILVLDEATSALDATSRVQVFESIKKWRQNRTTIVITHDLSQIIPDDFVYVMKDGIVAEQGFRSDLMAKGPLYGIFASLAAEQAVQPVPAKHEEYIEYEGSFMEVLEGDDDRRQSRFGGALPVNRLGYRPPSTAYYGLLDEYSKGSRQSVFEDGHGQRPMSVAQKRLSWAPRDLVAPRPISRMSFVSRPSYGSRPSHEGTPTISIRRPSFESRTSPFATPLEKDKQLSASTLSYRHNAGSFHQEDDIEDLKIIASPPPVKAVAVKHKSVATIIFSHFPNLPSKHLLIIGIAASVGHGVCTPFWSNYLSNIMAAVGQGGRSPTLTQNTLIVFGLCIAQGLSNTLQDWTLFTLAARWTAKLRLQAFNTVLAQDRSFFDESINAPSAIMQIIIKDIDDMRNLMAEVVGKVVVFVVMVGMGLIWAMIVQWRLTLVGLSVGPALAVTVILNEAMVGRAETRNKLKREAVAKTFYESVANVRGIRAMALGSAFFDKFSSEARAAKSLGQRDAWGIAIGAALSAGLPLFIQALMNWAGMLFILQGHMNYAQMLQVYNLVLFSLTFGTALLDFIPQLSKAKIAASDFDRLYKLSHTTAETAGDLRYPITGNLSFSNVNFAYTTRPDVPIFENLSFELRAGECVAVVGPSGSGKSTIAALLQRLYEPSNGVILFDKHRLDSTDTRWLREHVAVVSQSANLFDASVADNIAYGSSVAIGEIHRAARAANIHDFIMGLPEGYETRLGENASLISGGQAQRLQIARALVRRSNILILDEATSALDVDNAKAILDTIVKIKESRTTVFITHSVEAMRRCDRILCLGGGRVVEDGTFEELVSRGGEFAQLMQTGEWE